MNANFQHLELTAELRDIAVTYGERQAAVHAVRGVSLAVRRGEVLLLMGPSGSGKSTLLQVLGCIRSPTSGSVLIQGTATHGLTPDQLSTMRRQRIGFVFQHYNLLPELRAWENVGIALELRGQIGPAVEEASRQLLDRLGLVRRADAFPAELSGGEKQRIAIARAIVGNPDLVLADEPTAALDASTGGEVAKILASVARESNRAVVIVTHDARISAIADRVAILEDGCIQSIQSQVHAQRRILEGSDIHDLEIRNPRSTDVFHHGGVAAASGEELEHSPRFGPRDHRAAG